MRVNHVLLITALVATISMRSDATSVCLNYHDARKLWPRIHLWWIYDKETGNKCWTNRRGKPPRGLKFDPVFSKANAQAIEQEKRPEPKPARAVVKIVKAEDFNEIDAAADQGTFFDAKPFPYQAYVMNLDRYRETSWHRQIWGLAQSPR